ncbi:uncharacterized protein RCO7_05708 [Rhynchosporium graminicola]|uniref:Uncharacterized protein n=1 Tax=Rhynchosporium graminicola TaxID=2792576 RepID=A0A1E1KBU0_9HELO|nr:uncharacterized protein RCO7_05708 [Rhynchosporium commune]
MSLKIPAKRLLKDMFDGQKEGNKSLKPLDFSLLSEARTRSLIFSKRPLGFSEENASVLELHSFLDVKRISSKVSVLELHSFLDVKRISSKVLRGGRSPIDSAKSEDNSPTCRKKAWKTSLLQEDNEESFQDFLHPHLSGLLQYIKPSQLLARYFFVVFAGKLPSWFAMFRQNKVSETVYIITRDPNPLCAELGPVSLRKNVGFDLLPEFLADG